MINVSLMNLIKFNNKVMLSSKVHQVVACYKVVEAVVVVLFGCLH
jgi:hypothetical protein